MRNIQKDCMFDYFIQGMDEKMQTTLNMMYLNSCMIDEENHRREMAQMKEEIVQEVLSRISATVDVTEIFDAIDGLNEKIESLGKIHNRREELSLPAVPIEKEKMENAEHSSKPTACSDSQRTRLV